jgi:hypothetical protein
MVKYIDMSFWKLVQILLTKLTFMNNFPCKLAILREKRWAYLATEH